MFFFFFFFKAEEGIRVLVRFGGLGEVYRDRLRFLQVMTIHIMPKILLLHMVVGSFLLYGGKTLLMSL